MKKYLIFTIQIIFFVACTAQNRKEIKEPKIPKRIDYQSEDDKSEKKYKKSDRWYSQKNKLDKFNFKDAKSLNEVKQNYQIKKGLLYYKNKIVDSLMINYRKNDSIIYIAWINKGIPVKHIVNIIGHPRPSQFYTLYNSNNIEIYSPEGDTFLPDGTGYWKSFYYGKWRNNSQNRYYENGSLKAEGEVQNNYKTGEWKYYNKLGELESIKIYSIKDSIDIRFPQCIFNEVESCQ